MKTTQKQSASKTTKTPAKAQKPTTKEEPHYSLLGVENAESIKGRALLMNAEEAATILQHIGTKYPRLTLAKNVVVRLADERKNGVLLRCSVTGKAVLKRTSDLFQQPVPFTSDEARQAAKTKAKAERDAKTATKAPAKPWATSKGSKMLTKAMDEVKARAAKGSSSAKVTVARTPKAKATPMTAPAAAPSVPATVAATSSPTTQG